MSRTLCLLALLIPTALSAQDAESGRELYMTHCATCHGADGQGDGPMASVLLIQPTNLTALVEGSGGVFPVERVVKRIDGRDPLVAHGSPMPVYGDFFEGRYDLMLRLEHEQGVRATRPLADLVAYIAELQQSSD
ncbi:c-type cytochrome [Allosediminivita pacifica]|uniref:Cytochrome c n=1 Tax=Allosediminivita pacifica TaxID=1267769 RepID=A0A2T6B7Y4_9RHOB|nr:cytochrome c [Allosediminivita pacifica]PTX52164.1 cytochrome c [Allosediminivita pacifica]GGA96625.1 hypothetical protein GCM10011324_03620 [Allosediminivita pacifica]